MRDPYPSNLRILDCTTNTKEAEETFNKERIPGARFLDLNNKFIDPEGKYPTTYPPEKIVRKRLGELGIKKGDEIILYVNDKNTRFATRAQFIFKSYGFEKAAVLNGGLALWKKNGYPVETTPPPEEYKDEYTDELADPAHHVATYGDIKAIENQTEEHLIIDARSKEEYHGEKEPSVEGVKAGHIPNAINLPASGLIKDDGTFKAIDEIKDILEKNSVDKNKNIVCHCNNGNQATLIAVALKECGYKNVKLYDGSWTEYGSNL